MQQEGKCVKIITFINMTVKQNNLLNKLLCLTVILIKVIIITQRYGRY